MKNVITCFRMFSQTVSQNLCQKINSNKLIQTGPVCNRRSNQGQLFLCNL